MTPRIDLLISLKLSGEATPEELKELETLVRKNSELLHRIEKMKKLWEQLDRHSTGLAEESFEKHLDRLNNEMYASNIVKSSSPGVRKMSPTRNRLQEKYYRMLWVLAVASVLFFWFFFKSNENAVEKPIRNTVSTKLGDKTNITLPDGSKVWLNKDSKITYEDFQKKTREVYLSGEAFFEVTKNKAKPFIIHTRTINLKVLGTAFNVRSYDNEKETETSLVRGSVEITLRNSPNQKILLRPGEKLLVKNTTGDTLTKDKKQKHVEETPIAVLTTLRYYGNDSSSVETSWTKNQLVFDNESLDKIALTLERWFNVRVTIVSEKLKKEKYTATLEDDDKLEDFLEALRLTGGFHFTLKNKEVVISP